MCNRRNLTVFLFVLLLLVGCSGGGGGGSNDDGGVTPKETSALLNASSAVEEAFVSGDTDKVLETLTDEARAFYQDDIGSIEPQMVHFGNDFKNRKLVYVSDNYAEYAFTAENETFTVAFSRQEDGTWKLMRF